MKIVEFFATNWGMQHKLTDKEIAILRTFAKEIEKLMGIKEEADEEKN